jgi:hypothetical protein
MHPTVNVSDMIQIDQPFPAKEWFQAVGKAIGASPEVVEALMESWVILEKSGKEMEERLTILAKLNGKKLIFSSPDPS